MIDLVGVSFFPLCKVVGPMIFFLSLLLLRVIILVRYKGCGIWVLTAFWGTLFQLAVSPFNSIDAAMEDVGMKVVQMMETEVARKPEEKELEKRSTEDLRRKYSTRGGQAGTVRRGHPTPSRVQEQRPRTVQT